MLEIWRERPDLQREFDLHTQSGRMGAFWWLYMHGFAEMGFSPDQNRDNVACVNTPVPGLPRHGPLPISWLMREIWMRSEEHPYGTLKDFREQNNFLIEFFSFRLTDRYLEGFLTREQAKVLLECGPDLPDVPRICRWIHQSDANVRSRFRDCSDPAFLDWCRAEGGMCYPILAHPLVGIAIPQSTGAIRPFGVNVIGYAHARLGIAEDMRMAARALEAEGVPYSLYNVRAGVSITEHNDDAQFALSDTLPYDTNLFCMTGMGMITAMLARRDRFAQRRNIGLWPWELSAWPDFWQHAYDFVDEVWAASDFTTSAYLKSSPRTVKHVPVAVTVNETESLSRADFLLPENVFLFAFTFDALSAFARKNPSGVIAAFKRAFPNQSQNVGLVLKGMRTEGSPEWQELLDLVDDDPRIHIVTESMSRGRLLDLYRNIDCFVSLHRSEGLGRNILECMALGKPVIVTAYSGNMDFTTEQTAALVGFKPIPVEPGDYPFGAGQNWADPSIDEAAALMRRMMQDADWRQGIASAGQTLVREQYSPQTVGRHWRRLLAPVASE